MSDDDFISREQRYTEFEGEDRMQTLERISTEVALLSPAERIAHLKQLDTLIETDCSSTISEMKERASLVSLKRAIEDTHRKLLAAKR